jgi:hypothetical protein
VQALLYLHAEGKDTADVGLPAKREGESRAKAPQNTTYALKKKARPSLYSSLRGAVWLPGEAAAAFTVSSSVVGFQGC